LRLPPAVRAKLEYAAAESGVSVNRYVAIVLARQLGVPLSVLRSRASAERERELEARAPRLSDRD